METAVGGSLHDPGVLSVSIGQPRSIFTPSHVNSSITTKHEVHHNSWSILRHRSLPACFPYPVPCSHPSHLCASQWAAFHERERSCKQRTGSSAQPPVIRPYLGLFQGSSPEADSVAEYFLCHVIPPCMILMVENPHESTDNCQAGSSRVNVLMGSLGQQHAGAFPSHVCGFPLLPLNSCTT